ncbi:MAG: hypothetical protein EZS28_020829 [Streblomastix strix]|uniref:Uncharacterized protein n=1 Tax=Streblomastix strix TaxID=222440 RepID=A0A5J4VMF7_9EUKA|nr:MAG: hypothetical protein EZS28_020829 [Streblomastix strix]
MCNCEFRQIEDESQFESPLDRELRIDKDGGGLIIIHGEIKPQIKGKGIQFINYTTTLQDTYEQSKNPGYFYSEKVKSLCISLIQSESLIETVFQSFSNLSLNSSLRLLSLSNGGGSNCSDYVTRFIFAKYHIIAGLSLLLFFFVQLSSQKTGEVEGVDVYQNVRMTFEIGLLMMEVLTDQKLLISLQAVAFITSSNFGSENAIIATIVHPRKPIPFQIVTTKKQILFRDFFTSRDYGIRKEILNEALQELAISPTIDYFANGKSLKCRRFYNLIRDLWAQGQDGMKANWQIEMQRLHPPNIVDTMSSKLSQERLNRSNNDRNTLASSERQNMKGKTATPSRRRADSAYQSACAITLLFNVDGRYEHKFNSKVHKQIMKMHRAANRQVIKEKSIYNLDDLLKIQEQKAKIVEQLIEDTLLGCTIVAIIAFSEPKLEEVMKATAQRDINNFWSVNTSIIKRPISNVILTFQQTSTPSTSPVFWLDNWTKKNSKRLRPAII